MFKFEKTQQEKMIDKQKAFDYCVYMMLSSYYKKTVCLSDVMETNLFLRYRELRDNMAVELESEAIKVIEKEILPKIPEAIEEKEAQVVILPWNNTYGCHGIQVTTDGSVVTVYIKKEGKQKKTNLFIRELL